MFLLFLCLGIANVNAQVRIGGNAAPQGAAVLDLNADNTATPATNKGALALPRVRLDTTNMQLNGTTPITGMLVWNTNTSLGTGIYYWSGTAWVKTDLPSTAPIDSGKCLVSNGKTWMVAMPGYGSNFRMPDTIRAWRHDTVTTTLIFDSVFVIPTAVPLRSMLYFAMPGVTANKHRCEAITSETGNSFYPSICAAVNGAVYVYPYFAAAMPAGREIRIRILQVSR